MLLCDYCGDEISPGPESISVYAKDADVRYIHVGDDIPSGFQRVTVYAKGDKVVYQRKGDEVVYQRKGDEDSCNNNFKGLLSVHVYCKGDGVIYTNEGEEIPERYKRVTVCVNSDTTDEIKGLKVKEVLHKQCLTLNIPRGQEALETFRNISTQSNVLCMAIHVNYIHGLAQENREQNKRKKEKRAIKTKVLLKNATALRNSNSGHLLIHFVGREEEDTFTGAFDEFADDKLQTLIQDGSLFTDVYTKRFLSDYATDLDKLQKKQQGVLEEISGKLEGKARELQGQKEQLDKLNLKTKETLGEELFEEILKILKQKIAETSKEIERLKNIKLKEEKKLSVCVDKDTLKDTHQYKDFLVLYVEGGVYLTTSDSKTKIALDERIITPSDQTLITFLKNRTQFKSVHPSGHTLKDLSTLHESRSVQFKGYFKGKETDEKIVRFMFDDHKFLEYVSAFTKNTDGGTYFLGIAEIDRSFNGSLYKSRSLDIQRVPICSQQTVEAKIKEGVSKGVLICDYDGHEIQNGLVDVFFIQRDSDMQGTAAKVPGGFVIEIHVQPVSGIMFYDTQGPLAYRVEGDAVTAYSVEEWFHAVIVNSVVIMQNMPGRELCLNSKDFRRPRLTPIKESITAIKSNFVKKGTLNVVPSRIPAHLLDVRDAFISLLKTDGVLYHEDVVNGEYLSERDTTCLLYLSESLATLLDFPVSRPQGNTRCDIFIAMPHQPIMVLTLIDDGSETEEIRNYNTSVAREVTSKLRRFTNESINVIHGVLSLSDLTDTDTCFIKLQRLAALAVSFVPKTSLLMTPSKYEHVMMAFWAAVAETKSILTETSEVDDSCINFLTTDQCVYLVENIDSKYVQARWEPGSGTTTLMLEVARRLSRLGETLLICNSLEERDRLRSVHSSTITTSDVEDLNMSKFENVVHETRSYLFEPCGRQWLFLKGTPNRSRDIHVQTINASNGKEDGFHYFNSKDFLRPQLQQTREHITDIKRHYMSKGGVNIAPTNLPGHIVDIKDMLLSLLETDESLYRCNLVTGAVLDTCGDTTCFVHLTESLAITLDFPVLERPTPIRCDMFLAIPHQPLVVLTVITCDKEAYMVRSYNTSVAREVTLKLRRFTNESINVIHGVVCTNDMKDPCVFFAKLQNIAVISSAFVSKTSLLMNSFKYDQILMAFWAALAETKVDPNESQLGFLTKEHCILLFENINSSNVEVRLHSKREATVLMLEVAKRLSRLGDTLLICRSRGERDRLRSVHASTISLNDVWKWDLSAYENIVLDARILPCRPRGRVWRFQTDPTSVEELRMRLQTAEEEVHEMENKLCGLHDDKWKRQIEYWMWEVDVLKLLRLVQELDVSNIVRSSIIAEPLKKGLSFEEEDGDPQTDVRRTRMMKLQDEMENQKDLFQLLRSAVIEDKTKLTRLQDLAISAAEASEPVKQFIEEKPKRFFGKAVESLRKKVSGFRKRGKHPGKKTKQSKIDSIAYATLWDSAKDETMKDSPSETSLDPASVTSLKDPASVTSLKDLEESQENFDDIEKLAEDLDIVEKEKDKVMLQLSPLYTAEWQNTLSYVDRNIGIISRFKGPRFDTTDYERQDHLMLGDSSETPRDSPDTDNQRRQTQKSHVLQIRQFQQGRLSRPPLYAMLENMIADDKAAMTHYQDSILSVKQDGSALHFFEDISSWLPVLCPKLHLDAARANTDECHVTTDGELVNSRPDTRPRDNRRRLRIYWGTCASTPIPLSPPHPTLTPVYSTPRYWEILTGVRVLRGEWWFAVLEMGVSEAGQVDSGVWTSLQGRSWCVTVGGCGSHGRSDCTTVWREGKQGECQQNTMSHTPGTQATFHYGVVLDVGRGRIAFIDLNRGVVLARFDERFREDLYPMFGVWPRPEDCTINMKLISGADIDITDTKKSLIHDALT